MGGCAEGVFGDGVGSLSRVRRTFGVHTFSRNFTAALGGSFERDVGLDRINQLERR